jgi:hypothetical protein
MIIHVTDARYLREYQFEVSFSDGRRGIVDLRMLPDGPVFEALRDRTVFAKGTLDAEVGTIVWPGGADLAPEYLYFLAFRDDRDLADLFHQWGYLQEQPAASR